MLQKTHQSVGTRQCNDVLIRQAHPIENISQMWWSCLNIKNIIGHIQYSRKYLIAKTGTLHIAFMAKGLAIPQEKMRVAYLLWHLAIFLLVVMQVNPAKRNRMQHEQSLITENPSYATNNFEKFLHPFCWLTDKSFPCNWNKIKPKIVSWRCNKDTLRPATKSMVGPPVTSTATTPASCSTNGCTQHFLVS